MCNFKLEADIECMTQEQQQWAAEFNLNKQDLVEAFLTHISHYTFGHDINAYCFSNGDFHFFGTYMEYDTMMSGCCCATCANPLCPDIADPNAARDYVCNEYVEEAFEWNC